RTYFQSGAGNLEPSESAILAGAIVNPRVLNPAHPNARLLRRQGIIMRRMGSVTPPAPVEDVVIPPPAPPVDSENVEPLGREPLASPAPEEPTAEPESPDSTNPANSQGEPVTDLNPAPQ
ncbi:MAG TPA: hypothetical protein VGJ39_04155, partial [Vicinamibacterales bacterium]